MLLIGEGARVGAGAGTNGAPRPSDGNGVSACSFCGTLRVAAAGDGTAWVGAKVRASELPLRLPNTNYVSSASRYYFRLISLLSSGDSKPPLFLLASARPVSTCANWRNIS